MKRISKPLIVVIAALGLLAIGCRANPVYNVQDAAIVTGKANASADDVQKAILRAGTSLGWTMKPAGNSILGTLTLRSHVAIVEIKYNPKTYSILYKDSQNLDYNGSTIHSNYNGWVQNLNRAIQAQLQAL